MIDGEMLDLIRRIVGTVNTNNIRRLVITWDELDGTDIKIEFKQRRGY